MYRSNEVQEINADALIVRIQSTTSFPDIISTQIVEIIQQFQKDLLSMMSRQGVEHPESLVKMSALAELYIDIEFYSIAEDILRRALLGKKRTFGLSNLLYQRLWVGLLTR